MSTDNESPIGSHYRIDRYLDRVRSLYPMGIPKEVMSAAIKRRAENAAFIQGEPSVANAELRQDGARKVLFLVASAAASLSPQEEELLESIITKGLQIARSEAEVVVGALFDIGEDLSGWVRASQESHPAQVTVCMGFQLYPHGKWEDSERGVLHTLSLAEVIASKESKRIFWGHLKGVIARIA